MPVQNKVDWLNRRVVLTPNLVCPKIAIPGMVCRIIVLIDCRDSVGQRFLHFVTEMRCYFPIIRAVLADLS